jgi:putative aminopeptidase FrvX
MKDETLRLYQKLTEAPGAPGFESEVRQIMRTEISKYTDEIIQDNLGSIFGVLRGTEKRPKIMVAGHMDEVGFMVTHITEKGFIKFQALGGWWSQVLLAQRVKIYTDKGSVDGVIGSTPPHVLSEEQRKAPVKLEQMFIDIGADSKEQAETIGIRPGQPILPVCPFTPLANTKKIMAKAWDNRFGCGLALELLEEASQQAHPNTLYVGAHVQEEVGLRGAAASANMIQPDLFFALDAGPANDIPGVSEGFGKLGKGVLIRIFDRSMITHRGLRDFILDHAEAEKIPYQFFVSQGGTDAGRVHLSGAGVPSAVIGICARYIHSHAAIADTDDLEAAKKLLVTLVGKMDQSTLQLIKSNV